MRLVLPAATAAVICLLSCSPPEAPIAIELPLEVPVAPERAVQRACRAEHGTDVYHHLRGGQLLLREKHEWRLWYYYAPAGHLKYRVLDYDSNGAPDRIWTYTWLESGRLQIEEQTHPVWALSGRTEMTFDPAGLLQTSDVVDLVSGDSTHEEWTFRDGRPSSRIASRWGAASSAPSEAGDTEAWWPGAPSQRPHEMDLYFHEANWVGIGHGGCDAGSGAPCPMSREASFDRRGRMSVSDGIRWDYTCRSAPVRAPGDEDWHVFPPTATAYGPR